ncbi:MAG: endonuclease/exonuclease/phosphatase family protein [Bacteroidota bacterium]
MNRIITVLFSVLGFAVAQAQVTKIGNDTLLDIACWNVEWFGDATSGNGPNNEPLQYANVKGVLQNADIDVWGLAEVSNTNTFATLLAELTDYSGLESSYSQTQKTALIWKKSMFTLLSSTNISDATEPNFSNAFAGRVPLEVALITKGNAIKDTIYFYVVHLKANSSGDNQPNYNRRKDASTYLKKYLDNNRKGKKVVVLGDWNDDVDASVVKVSGSYLETPFANFINDSANYFFTSRALSFAGETSYPNFNPKNMIDHMLNTKALLDSFYIQNSCMVLKQLSAQIASYTSTTSDHYPVMSRYNMKRYLKPEVPDTTPQDTTPPTGLSVISGHIIMHCYPNPASGKLFVETPDKINSLELYSLTGQLLFTTRPNATHYTLMLPEKTVSGIYVLRVRTEKGIGVKRVMIE